jgi:taurine dioxygenase
VLWDNRTLIHTATEYDRERHRRLIWRTSVRGEVPLPGGGILAPVPASQ